MNKEKIKHHIMKSFTEDEEMVGFFSGQGRLKIWLFFVIGPLAVFNLRSYYVGVTTKGVHFHTLDILGKPAHHSFFAYNEIKKIQLGKGVVQLPVTFVFDNGRDVLIKAQKKGLDRIPKIDDTTLDYLRAQVRVL